MKTVSTSTVTVVRNVVLPKPLTEARLRDPQVRAALKRQIEAAGFKWVNAAK